MRIRGRGSMKSGKPVGVLIGVYAVWFSHTSPEHRHNFYMLLGAVWISCVSILAVHLFPLGYQWEQGNCREGHDRCFRWSVFERFRMCTPFLQSLSL